MKGLFSELPAWLTQGGLAGTRDTDRDAAVPEVII